MTQWTDALIVVAQAEPDGQPVKEGPPPGNAGSLSFFVPIVLIMVAFFWLTSRSQKKRERERQNMLDAIKPKDLVVTVGGMHGRVIEIKEDSIVLRVDSDKDVRVTITKNSISRRTGDEEGGES